MKRLKRYKVVFILLILIAIMCVGIRIYGLYHADKEEYLGYYDEYTSISDTLLEDVVTIAGLQDDETYYEDMLYQGMTAYYQDSDDEVLRYVFEQRFPLPHDYENDRKSAFVVIYALLELYPEMKQNKVIKESVLGINDTLDELKQTIDTHNENVDRCNELATKINNSNYVNRWDPDSFIDTEIKKVLFVEE